jgi:hypothetical protein
MTYIQKNTGFFCEDNGNPSSMRLICFIFGLASIGFGAVAVTKPNAEAGAATNISFAFMTAAVTGKVSQKFLEEK